MRDNQACQRHIYGVDEKKNETQILIDISQKIQTCMVILKNIPLCLSTF